MSLASEWPADANWRERLAAFAHQKLTSADAAVAEIGSGAVVHVAPYQSTPFTLVEALKTSALERGLSGIQIDHSAAFTNWTSPDLAGVFRLRDNFATPFNREAAQTGAMDYMPVGIWKTGEIAAGFDQHPDFFLVPVSPPDTNGFCSFGQGLWFSKILARQAKRVIAEVHPEFIRTGGDNYIHIDEIDVLVEALPSSTPAFEVPTPREEEADVIAAICTMVAAELVADGDTLQMGVGKVSASLGPFLDFRNDLGVQTELITGGVADLVRSGVVTGKQKTIFPGKVVGAACVTLPFEELAFIHENPIFELYDFGRTDDLRTLIQQERFVAVNNALVVDLTGQVSAEALDHRPFTGVGGQTVFMIAGAYSKGGRSVSVLPSGSVPSETGVRVSRIVPTLNPGTPITVPRTYVDHVVTEHGIADLRGRSIGERAGALIEIAHPDFREELTSQAKRLFGR